MRHSTIGIAASLLLIGSGVGLWLCSPNDSGRPILSDQQTSAPLPEDFAMEPEPEDESHYIIRGQDPVKPPNLLRTSSPKPLPPNPLRSDERPIPTTIGNHSGEIRPVSDASPFDFPAPLAPPQGSLLEGAGFPTAETTPTASSPQPLPPAVPEIPAAPVPKADPFATPPQTPGMAKTLDPLPPIPLVDRSPEPQPLPVPPAGLSSVTVGEPTAPSPLETADPFGESSSIVAVPPPAATAPAATAPAPMALPVQESPTVANSYRTPVDPGIENMEGTGIPGPSALEGAQTPHITIEKVLPAEITVDQPATLKTVLRNVGRSPAKDIVLRDRVPQGTRLLSTVPEGTMTASGELIWSLGNLNANEQIAVEMRILPHREGEIGSVASVGYTADASARIAVTRPMLQVQVKAPQEVQLGQTVNLEITISNPGTATATGIVLTEYVPDGLYHKDGKILENKNIDTLKPKETKRLILPLTCTGAGNLVNRLVIRADGNLSVEEKTTIRALSPMLNLQIVGPRERFLERRAGYRLVVSNPGTASATNVELVVYLPEAVQFVSTNQSGVYEKASHTVHWALEELPPQESGEIELVVLPIKSGEHMIRFAGNGQNGLKAEEAQTLAVDGLAALSFEVACLSNLVEVGRDTVYEIRVSNRGTKSSANVVVTTNLPEGMNFVSAEGPVRYGSNKGVIRFEPLAQLESKGEKVYRVTAKCMTDGDHRISVQVQSDELRAPITKEESTRVFK